MKNVVIYASATGAQLAHLIQLATTNNINLQIMEVGDASTPAEAPVQTQTALTSTHIGVIADLWGKSIIEIVDLVRARSITTVEQGIAFALPGKIKEYLESQL